MIRCISDIEKVSHIGSVRGTSKHSRGVCPCVEGVARNTTWADCGIDWGIGAISDMDSNDVCDTLRHDSARHRHRCRLMWELRWRGNS